jgi:hypothetical protein
MVLGQTYAATKLAATACFLGLGDEAFQSRTPVLGEHIAHLFRAVEIHH